MARNMNARKFTRGANSRKPLTEFDLLSPLELREVHKQLEQVIKGSWSAEAEEVIPYALTQKGAAHVIGA